MNAIKAIVTDIEGTTSSISFVRDVLFPYARAALPKFIEDNHSKLEVSLYIKRIAEQTQISANDLDSIINTLITWIDHDVKNTNLKALQGMIWVDGYLNGTYAAPVYEDAYKQLLQWQQAGIPLYVYSSGSVPAQKLFFKHSQKGDLTVLFSDYFDTEMGGKRSASSYSAIAEHIKIPAENILFLSDIVEELDAAREAGWQTILIDRLEDYVEPRVDALANKHTRVTEFTAIQV
ncbi:MAG: acireductone synthase [Arenimonas sp.]|nr:acireductone synthase [Arenimonas sp.]